MAYYPPQAPIFVPSSAPTSIGIGLNALNADASGANNLAIGNNAGSALTTGANNIVILTGNATDPTSAATANTLTISGGATAVLSATAINSTPTVTVPGNLTVSGTLTHSGGSVQAPVAAGATLAVTAAMAGATILLNTAAGSTVTLPAATGSGSAFTFVVTTTASSNAHKVLAASVSDFMNGIVTGENAGTAKCFASAAATNHSLQMPFAGTQPSGGFIGDWFTVTDIAANLWTVRGMYQAGTTPTTPFSAATT